jgi:hypothetical protein
MSENEVEVPEVAPETDDDALVDIPDMQPLAVVSIDELMNSLSVQGNARDSEAFGMQESVQHPFHDVTLHIPVNDLPRGMRVNLSTEDVRGLCNDEFMPSRIGFRNYMNDTQNSYVLSSSVHRLNPATGESIIETPVNKIPHHVAVMARNSSNTKASLFRKGNKIAAMATGVHALLTPNKNMSPIHFNTDNLVIAARESSLQEGEQLPIDYNPSDLQINLRDQASDRRQLWAPLIRNRDKFYANVSQTRMFNPDGKKVEDNTVLHIPQYTSENEQIKNQPMFELIAGNLNNIPEDQQPVIRDDHFVLTTESREGGLQEHQIGMKVMDIRESTVKQLQENWEKAMESAEKIANGTQLRIHIKPIFVAHDDGSMESAKENTRDDFIAVNMRLFR